MTAPTTSQHKMYTSTFTPSLLNFKPFCPSSSLNPISLLQIHSLHITNFPLISLSFSPPIFPLIIVFVFSLFLIYFFYCFTQTHISMFCCLVVSVSLLYVSLSIITILLLLITKRDVTGDMYSYNCKCAHAGMQTFHSLRQSHFQSHIQSTHLSPIPTHKLSMHPPVLTDTEADTQSDHQYTLFSAIHSLYNPPMYTYQLCHPSPPYTIFVHKHLCLLMDINSSTRVQAINMDMPLTFIFTDITHQQFLQLNL